jgi:hypothetical protein
LRGIWDRRNGDRVRVLEGGCNHPRRAWTAGLALTPNAERGHAARRAIGETR